MSKVERMKGLLRVFSVFVLVGVFSFSGVFNGIVCAQDSQTEKHKKEMVLGFMDDHPELNSKFFDLFLTMTVLQSAYVDKKSFEEYLNLAIKGMAEGLDPYSNIFIGEEAERFSESLKEKTGAGIGITTVRFGKEIYVASVVSGSPAEKAGLEPGDRIVKAGDKKLYGLSVEEAANLIRGPENEEVSLEINARRYQKPRVVKIIRKKITYPSVEAKQLANRVGYIKISSFGVETPERLREALRSMKENNGLVIDLRGNPGGLLGSVAKILGYFVGPGKVIMVEKKRTEKNLVEEKMSVTATTKENYPSKVVVLIDNFSASASEIMAGNLRHYKVATLMGVRTFGKALVQASFDIDTTDHVPDKSKLLVKVTIAKYLLPNGQDISGSGVGPDIEVEQAENFRIYERRTKKDLQFRQAVKFLRK